VVAGLERGDERGVARLGEPECAHAGAGGSDFISVASVVVGADLRGAAGEAKAVHQQNPSDSFTKSRSREKCRNGGIVFISLVASG
jgi:hypothetical protein